MTADEIKIVRAIMQRVDDGGNDGADIYEAEAILDHYAEKYGMTHQEILSLCQ
jgi:hypothetical protein